MVAIWDVDQMRDLPRCGVVLTIIHKATGCMPLAGLDASGGLVNFNACPVNALKGGSQVLPWILQGGKIYGY